LPFASFLVEIEKRWIGGTWDGWQSGEKIHKLLTQKIPALLDLRRELQKCAETLNRGPHRDGKRFLELPKSPLPENWLWDIGSEVRANEL
jgi:hypothetical protein